MTLSARIKLLLIGQAIALALAVWIVAAVQREQAADLRLQDRAARQMLIAVLDWRGGLEDFLRTGQLEAFVRFQAAGARLEAALETASGAQPRGRVGGALADLSASAQRLGGAGAAAIAGLQEQDAPGEQTTRAEIEAATTAFREELDAYTALIDRRLVGELSRMVNTIIGVVVALGLLFVGLAYLLVDRWGRRTRRVQREAERLARSRDALRERLSLATDEERGLAMLCEHLEDLVPGTRVLTVGRHSDGSADDGAGGDEGPVGLDAVMAEAPTADCLALRLGRVHEAGRGPEGDPGASCSACGALPQAVLCVPLMLAGESAGSLLIVAERSLTAFQRHHVLTSIELAAPALVNLRSLAQAERRAATDALTGLPNRRAATETLRRMGAAAGRGGGTLSAMILDLDQFKALNDRYGHRRGDDALDAVAEVLKTSLRASDFAGRWGGEEFIVLLPDTDRSGTLGVAEILRRRIRKVRVPGVDRGLSVSIGVAQLPHDAGDIDSLLREADAALYEAKAAGRDCVRSAEVENAR